MCPAKQSKKQLYSKCARHDTTRHDTCVDIFVRCECCKTLVSFVERNFRHVNPVIIDYCSICYTLCICLFFPYLYASIHGEKERSFLVVCFRTILFSFLVVPWGSSYVRTLALAVSLLQHVLLAIVVGLAVHP